MARGWESKSVEAQMESAEDRISRKRTRGAEPSAAQIELSRKRETLRLSRTRVLHELETSKNPRYVLLLHRELAALDENIRKLG